jgi:plasmid stability protein
MASITITQLDDATLDRLRRRAAAHGRSLEEEVEDIVKKAVPTPRPSTNGKTLTTQSAGSLNRWVVSNSRRSLEIPSEIHPASSK